MAMLCQVNVLSVEQTRTRWVVLEDWSARVSGVGGDWLVPSKGFVFWLLLDLLEAMRETGGTESCEGWMYCPLDQDAAISRALASPLLPVLEGPYALPGPPVTTEGFDRRIDFLCRSAGEYIASVEICNRKHHAANPYLNCDPPPQADYLIEATDSRWLSFLVPGTRMESADYPPEQECDRRARRQAELPPAADGGA